MRKGRERGREREREGTAGKERVRKEHYRDRGPVEGLGESEKGRQEQLKGEMVEEREKRE